MAQTSAATPSHPRTPALDVEGLSHACGVAVDSKGDLYAASAGASKVLIFSPSDHKTPIGEIANAKEPCALALTSKGNLYVSEAKTGEVVRYVPTEYPFAGKPSYGPREVIDASGQAKGISVDRLDDRLYVVEGTRISAYDAEGGLGVNETQDVRCFSCTGGSYKLIFNGEETEAIPFETEAKVVKEALIALAAFEPADISVENEAGNDRAHFVTFKGKYGHSDVEALQCKDVSLEGSGHECQISEKVKSWDGRIGEGDLVEATGVAAYAYEGNSVTFHLAVADAAEDQIKLFSSNGQKGAAFKAQELRRTLSGPKEGEDFGFGTLGAYLAADPGSCPPKGQACSAGHFLLYDDEHEALEEFEADGEFVSRTPFTAGDGAPTAIAVDRSGGAGDGTLYATTGAGTGARALAFSPLGEPSRAGPLAEQSLTLAKACSVAIDDFGNRYVAVGPEVFVYPPTGSKTLTKFSTGTKSCRIAVDGEGDVFALLKNAKEETEVAYFKPSSFPPKEGTTYGAAVTVVKQSEFGIEINALAIDPASGRLLANGAKKTIEYGSAKEGSKPIDEIAAGLSLGVREAVATCDRSGNLYLAGGGKVFLLDPTGKEVLTQITGVGSPSGTLAPHVLGLAVEQSDCHLLAFDPSYKTLKEFDDSGAYVASYGSFTSLVTLNYTVAVDNGASSPNKGDVYLAYDDTAKETPDLWAFGGLGYPPLPEHKLTLKKTGTGSGTVTSVPVGISCGKACSAEYEKGTGVVLRATPDPKNVFEGWSGCEAQFEGEPGEMLCEVTMQGDVEVGAEFTNIGGTFPLKVILEGSGSGKVTSAPEGIECKSTCKADFGKDSPVTLSAEPDPGSEVEEWEGCDSEPSQNECEVEMTEAKEVKVKLGPEHPLLRVEVGGSGSGEVISSPLGIIECPPDCEAKLDLGEEVTLSAEEDEGSEFTSWTGCDSEPSPSECEVTMEGPRTVKATFAELPQAIAKPPVPLGFTEATLRGEVGTAGLSTEFHFEYLTEAAAEQNEEEAKPPFEGAKSTPVGQLEPAEGFVSVSAPLSGLAEGTAYRFGLVVENEAGLAGDEGQFTTLKEQAEPCPNESLRTGASANLPDCRAYELVSPPEDGGYTVSWGASEYLNGNFATALAAAGGESVIFETYGGPLPEVGGNGVRNGYRAQRGAVGWSTASYGPTYAQMGLPLMGGVSVDQSYSFWAATGELGSLAPEATKYARYLTLPEPGAGPTCSPEPAGRFELIGCGSKGTDPEAIGRWISPGADHVIFTSDVPLQPSSPAKGTTAIYDRAPGSANAQVVSLLPGDITPGSSATYEGVSADGSAVAFGLGGTLYLRLDDSQTLEVSTTATFAGLARDGSALFYLKAGALYRFDTEEEEAAEIAPSGAFVNVAADGTRAYFTSTEALGPGGEPGKDSLYLWEAEGNQTHFIAVLAKGDLEGNVSLARWVTGLDPNANGTGTGPAIDPSRTTPDGGALVFQSLAPLTGYDSEGHAEIFRYDATDESLTCVSCGPEGTTANSDAQLQDEASSSSPVSSALAPIANLSNDGDTAFFTTAESLLPADHNGLADVYEWREGRLALISSGQSAYPSYLYAVSATGDDVFFATREALLAGDDEDGGSQSIYDARVDGGFAAAGGGGACEGEGCAGAPTAPPELNPPLQTASLPPEPPAEKTHTCPKGKHKVKSKGKTRCVKGKAKKKHGKKNKPANKHRHGRRSSR